MKTLAAVAVVVALWVVPQSGATVTVASASAQTLGVGIPDTLAAGGQGATTLGPNATSAATSVNAKATAQSFPSILLVQSASARNQTVRLALVGASGLANVTQASLALGSSAQIAIAGGNVTQATGAGAALAPSSSLAVGATVQMTSKSATATLTIDVTYLGATGGATLTQRWTLAIA